MLKYHLKEGVNLIENNENNALIYYFGNRYLLNGCFKEDVLEDLFTLLNEPKTKEEILYYFKDRIDEQCIDNVIEMFSKYNFLDIISDEQEFCLQSDDYQIYNFLSYFYNTTSNKAFNNLEKIKQSKIAVVNNGYIGQDLLESLSLSNFKEILLMDDNKVSDVDIYNNPRNFNKEDIGKLRGKAIIDNMKNNPVDLYWSNIEVNNLIDYDVILVTGTWFDIHNFQKINRFCLSNNKIWLCIIQDYFGGSVGPFMGIQDGPCFNCLINRKKSNISHLDKYNKIENYFSSNKENMNIGFSLFSKTLCNIAAIEAIKFITNAVLPKTLCGLYEFDLLNHRLEYHDILALPYCEICSKTNYFPLISKTSEV